MAKKPRSKLDNRVSKGHQPVPALEIVGHGNFHELNATWKGGRGSWTSTVTRTGMSETIIYFNHGGSKHSSGSFQKSNYEVMDVQKDKFQHGYRGKSWHVKHCKWDWSKMGVGKQCPHKRFQAVWIGSYCVLHAVGSFNMYDCSALFNYLIFYSPPCSKNPCWN